MMTNVIIGGLFLVVLYSIFKGKNKGSGTATGKTIKKDATKKDDNKSGFFGGGGMNDMFGMSKSNAK